MIGTANTVEQPEVKVNFTLTEILRALYMAHQSKSKKRYIINVRNVDINGPL